MCQKEEEGSTLPEMLRAGYYLSPNETYTFGGHTGTCFSLLKMWIGSLLQGSPEAGPEGMGQRSGLVQREEPEYLQHHDQRGERWPLSSSERDPFHTPGRLHFPGPSELGCEVSGCHAHVHFQALVRQRRSGEASLCLSISKPSISGFAWCAKEHSYLFSAWEKDLIEGQVWRRWQHVQLKTHRDENGGGRFRSNHDHHGQGER